MSYVIYYLHVLYLRHDLGSAGHLKPKMYSTEHLLQNVQASNAS